MTTQTSMTLVFETLVGMIEVAQLSNPGIKYNCTRFECGALVIDEFDAKTVGEFREFMTGNGFTLTHDYSISRTYILGFTTENTHDLMSDRLKELATQMGFHEALEHINKGEEMCPTDPRAVAQGLMLGTMVSAEADHKNPREYLASAEYLEFMRIGMTTSLPTAPVKETFELLAQYVEQFLPA